MGYKEIADEYGEKRGCQSPEIGRELPGETREGPLKGLTFAWHPWPGASWAWSVDGLCFLSFGHSSTQSSFLGHQVTPGHWKNPKKCWGLHLGRCKTEYVLVARTKEKPKRRLWGWTRMAAPATRTLAGPSEPSPYLGRLCCLLG